MSGFSFEVRAVTKDDFCDSDKRHRLGFTHGHSTTVEHLTDGELVETYLKLREYMKDVAPGLRS